MDADGGDVGEEAFADPAADLDAHVSARDVIETHPVQAANLHVLDRLGLYGKIGCLRPSYRNESRCRARCCFDPMGAR